MSRETIEWLNTMTLIGDTDKRGTAWHYRMGSTNHYPGAIPMADVRGLLVPFEPQRREIYVRDRDTGEYVLLPDFIGVAPDNSPNAIYAVHSDGYAVHPFGMLSDTIEQLVDEDNLHVSSAGLLAKGSIAWVEVAIKEVMTVEGFAYRPHLLGSTSANGRYRTKFGRKCQATVCDNTLDIADREVGQSVEISHTSGSMPRLKMIGEALGLIESQAVAFDEEIRALTSWKVNPGLFSRWLDEMVPEKSKDGDLLTGAALTRAERMREDMAQMWNADPRVSPWKDTALGILQLSNTRQHHNARITKATAHRVERNMLNTISGKTESEDMRALGILSGLSQAYGFTVPEKFEHIEIPQLATL